MWMLRIQIENPAQYEIIFAQIIENFSSIDFVIRRRMNSDGRQDGKENIL